LDARQNIARWTDVKLAVNNAHDHLIAIIQAKLTAYVGRQLQSAAADQSASMCVRPYHP
jgi:hypothetical protein